MSVTVYVAVTYHGYGHLAQTAPVVDAVAERFEGLKIVIESAAPRELLSRHFRTPFEHVRAATDFGMVMRDSLDVLVEPSHARYAGQHARWEEEVSNSAARLQAHEPQLVLANVPFIPLAAAARLRIPAVALCSLNWADVYNAYCRNLPGADRIYTQILEAYRSANVFIAPAPSMEMPALGNLVHVGPIARIGNRRRDELSVRLGVTRIQRLVAVFLGGVPTDLPLSRWPVTPGITWLIGGTDCPGRQDMVPLEGLNWPYRDVVSSCDALITKPGYGTIAEAGCNGIPVLCVPRGPWPEAPYLLEWLQANGRCLELSRAALAAGSVAASLDALWAQPERAPLAPVGIGEAAAVLERELTA